MRGRTAGLLELQALDYEGPARWRWRLTGPGGQFLADHQVSLDTTATEYEAFIDLHGYLRRYAAPDRRAASEAKIVGRVGRWIGEAVLGPVGPAIVAEAPVTVRVTLPAEAEALAYRPLELAYVDGKPLAVRDVSLVIEPAGTTAGTAKTPIGDRLRMLALFSLPTDATALNLRRERYELTWLVRTIAAVNHKAIELRVLQYGVTRERLREVLLEGDGWDMVHISGHGLPAGLLLEQSDGRQDLVSSAELVELLAPARQQIKLVTVSSCSSAALAVAEHLRLLGIDGVQPVAAGEPAPGAEPLPAVATELVARLGCAALAMRYPVADDFVIGLAERLYDLLLGKGQPLCRALRLALPEAVRDLGPPLSVATPALFGSSAAGLRLLPPVGGPVVFDEAKVKLAGFPAEPKRFVGRVGPMARGNAALAPHSGHSGVLFHGMAGAGKTACALELAYGHEQSFARLVWHKAPDEGHDITMALTNLALDLERRVPGLQLVHLVEDQAALEAFLPRMTEFLERERVLIVLDNLESLLTGRGDWRDERWGLLVDALIGHDGLSRVILTSRRRPQALDSRERAEPIHALSLAEAVLVARELPNLGRLFNDDTGRALVARTLAVVQGHSKLIELADGLAADPAKLEERLAEADQTWLAAGTRLQTFFEQGESTVPEQGFLHVLDGWTRASVKALPEPSAVLFHFLCALEEDDRHADVVKANWPDLWRRLDYSGDPPELDSALAPLEAQGLVAVESREDQQRVVYQLHPGIAETGRAMTGADFQTAVDVELAAFWTTAYQMALNQEAGEIGRLMLRAGRSAIPYLLRLQEWNSVGIVLEDVLNRDSSPSTVATLLPLLRWIAEATKGTEWELGHGHTLARALSFVQPAEAETQLRALLVTAIACEQFFIAVALTSDLIKIAERTNRWEDALTLVEKMKEYMRRAGLGPWTQLAGEAQRLKIIAAQGRSEEVLAAVEALREMMATLPDESETQETALPWDVREAILDIGQEAAYDVERWEEALALNAEIIKSQSRRDATAFELARTRLNDFGPLLHLERLEEAKTLVLRCQVVFEGERYTEGLGWVLTYLAQLENKVGHHDNARRLGQDALRYHYAAEDLKGIAISHFNLGHYMRQAGDHLSMALAHRLAAALIRFQTGAGRYASTLHALAHDLRSFDGDPPLPGSFAELCHLVDQVDGVHFAQLFERLPKQAPDGEAALAEVLQLARESG